MYVCMYVCRFVNSLVLLSPVSTSKHFQALHTSIEWALTHPDTRISLILDAEIAQQQQCEDSGSANATCDAYPLYDTLEIRNGVQYVLSTFAETDPIKCLTLLSKVSTTYIYTNINTYIYQNFIRTYIHIYTYIPFYVKIHT